MDSQSVLRITGKIRLIGVRVKEIIFPSSGCKDISIRKTDNFHNEGELLLFTLSWEKRHSSEELGEDAAETPHVDGSGVGNPKNDLRCAIES